MKSYSSRQMGRGAIVHFCGGTARKLSIDNGQGPSVEKAEEIEREAVTVVVAAAAAAVAESIVRVQGTKSMSPKRSGRQRG